MLIAALVLTGILIILAAVLSISDNLIHIEAHKEGINTRKTNMGLLPGLSELLGKKPPSHVINGSFHRLRKGFNINLAGEAHGPVLERRVNRYAVKPTDFRGIAPIPKVIVEVGDEVKAGDEIFFDKGNPDIKYVAPVSGEIVKIRRGQKRSISDVIILADKQARYKSMPAPADLTNREALVAHIMASGIWPYIIQRPFDLVPDPSIIPDRIFISTFSTAPLAISKSHILEGNDEHFQKGLDILLVLTVGVVHLGIDARPDSQVPAAITEAKNVEKHYFDGPHPVGNVGIQIHHIDPIKTNDVVWAVDVETVIALGKLFNLEKFEYHQVVGLAGAPFAKNIIYKCNAGASITELCADNLSPADEDYRIVCGDALSGRCIEKDDFISAHCSQLTAIEEGDQYELFGWLLPIRPRPSISRSYPAFLMPDMEYEPTTNTHGERRAFVVTSEYQKVMPMDIHVQPLMKAILVEDIERMEGLGINELTEEDVALCEFVCTSKMPLQQILREGLELMEEQA